jgi:hypothetical protein
VVEIVAGKMADLDEPVINRHRFDQSLWKERDKINGEDPDSEIDDWERCLSLY